MDNGGLGIPNPRYCTGLLVGVLRARLGRLVVLGSSRKRVAVTLASGHCAGAFAGGDGEAWQFPCLDRAVGD